jgi:nucleotide-binding universal stress UspA family protein
MQANLDHNRIVVGIDGSTIARAALRWAIHEAELHRAPLQLVHAWRPLYRGSADDPEYAEAVATSHAHGDELLSAAVAQTRAEAPTLTSSRSLESGRPSAVLIDACKGARMLVVGARGLGGFPGLQLGSVALHVVSNAPCSVAIVRSRPRTKGPVLVGIDGSSESKRVLAVAFEEAAARNAELVVVSALYVHSSAEGAPDYDLALAAARHQIRLTTEQCLADYRAQYPHVKVHPQFPIGYPAAILANESTNARLLVVGAHGGGGFSGMRLGSISHAVAHHAHCPVMVVRETVARA